ncbi:MAG: IclR family transcriptional regulator [Firmicutes bacterium]|nr:IclR family transcriptional regulator [Bacillota bacterium]
MERINTLRALEKALLIVSTFSLQKAEWGVSELAETLQLNKSNVFKILRTLTEYGFMEQDEGTRRYRLGLKFFELGMVVAARMELRKVALPIMEKLVASTGETCLLTVRQDTTSMCVEKVESREAVHMTAKVGLTSPLYAGASNKALLAFMDPEEVRKLISRLDIKSYTTETITDGTKLMEDLALARQRGYTYSVGEVERGIAALGAPVYDFAGHLVASLSLVGSASRLTPERSLELSGLVKRGADEISRQLGKVDTVSNSG